MAIKISGTTVIDDSRNLSNIANFNTLVDGRLSGGTGVTYTSGTISIGQAVGTGNDVQFDSFGVGTAASGTTGEIRATDNITAYYSDERLKDFKGTIPNALDKVNALNGYYFTSNETAQEFGYSDKKLQVGVSAQEVESVLPEVVTAAPFDIGKNEDSTEYSISGENYKTVYYEKLVPLLIEAIKELSKELRIIKMENTND